MEPHEPQHHKRYRLAWESWSDPDSSSEDKRKCEIEMDSAQDCFSYPEFQEFKKSLKGYCEFWAGLVDDLLKIGGE